jgi:hypothetical protein
MVARSSNLDKLMGRMTDLNLGDVQKDGMFMIYGDPGVGKTVLAVGLARKIVEPGQKVVFLDSNKGIVSLDNHPGLKKDLIHFKYGQYQDLPTLAQAIRDGKAPFDNVGAIVIDELSSIAESVLDTLLRERLGTPVGEIPEVVPDWTDYRPMGELIKKALFDLEDIDGLHVIVVAHAEQKADHRKVVITRPAFSPKLRGGIEKIMQVTGYVTAETKKEIGSDAATYVREIQVHPTKLVEAKCRVGGLPIKMGMVEFVNEVTDWLYDEDRQAADLAAAEFEGEGADDELPAEDGIQPADDAYDVDDDAPAFVSQD